MHGCKGACCQLHECMIDYMQMNLVVSTSEESKFNFLVQREIIKTKFKFFVIEEGKLAILKFTLC